MRIRRVLALGAAALIVVVLGYAAAVRVQSHHLVSLAATGKYAVGRTTREYVDRSRTDEFAPSGGNPRVLSVWLWYPVRLGTKGPAAAYAPGPWSALHKFGFAETDFRDISTGAITDALMADGSFPLVVLLPGLGFSAPQYSALAGALAARGYIVAGVTPSYSANLTVLDGRAVKATAAGNPRDIDDARADELVSVWSDDARYVASETPVVFGSKVDATHVLYVGHSLGGAASLEACRIDPRCSGAVDLDGTPYGPVVKSGLNKPLLLLSSWTGGAADDTATRTLFAATSGTALAYRVHGAEHFDFTDYTEYYLPWPLRSLLPLGSIGGNRAVQVVSGYVGAFADNATHGKAWTAPAYPEVHPASP